MRAIYSGALTIGMLNIPVKVYSAIDSHDVGLHQYCGNPSCGGRIEYRKYCANESIRKKDEEIVKGFPISQNNFIVVSKEEIQKIKPKTSKAVALEEFVDETFIDPVMIEKSYYLAPADKYPDKAFQLFVTALEKSSKVGIGKITLREREALIAVRPYSRGLLMQVLSFADEIQDINEIKEIKGLSKASISAREIDMAVAVIESMSNDDFRPEKYEDTYTKNLRQLIEAKAGGGTFTVPEVPEPAPTDDVMAALEATLKVTSKK